MEWEKVRKTSPKNLLLACLFLSGTVWTWEHRILAEMSAFLFLFFF